jgi:hypothetical protein
MPATSKDLLENGGVGTAAAYLILHVPTSWLGALPPLPDGAGTTLVPALGTVIGAAIHAVRRRRVNQTTEG